MFTIKVIFFDTETTWLDCSRCKIIELAMLTVENGVVIDEYDEFINVGEQISPEITQLTGITNEMVSSEGLSEEMVAQDLKERLTADTLMIAHNCQFDLQFVYHLLKRHFPNEADDIVSNLNWLDTVSVLKDRKEFPHKLIDAVKHYDIPEVNFHRAIDDTKALYNVTMAMKSERDDLREYINIFGFNPRYGVNGKRFEFIEYKSQSFHQRIVAPEFTLPNRKSLY
ncbi:3'-5' exonuclease [Methanobrevibacter sp.]|uniref:3'-5' exonuclease n=1 Tax=Methanobrevibacter sp. TaxID=66852 RepID=UPI003D7D2DA1